MLCFVKQGMLFRNIDMYFQYLHRILKYFQLESYILPNKSEIKLVLSTTKYREKLKIIKKYESSGLKPKFHKKISISIIFQSNKK